MIIIAVLSLFAVLALRASDIRKNDLDDTLLRADMENILVIVKSSLESVYVQGDGFSSVIEMPYRVSRYDYSVELSEGSISIICENVSVSERMYPFDIEGVISPGNNTITNVGGRLVIS